MVLRTRFLNLFHRQQSGSKQQQEQDRSTTNSTFAAIYTPPLRKSAMDKDDTRRKIYLFGDSLTEWGFEEDDRGWGYRLQEYYGESAVVLDRGVSGATTTSSIDRFQRTIIEECTKTNPRNPEPLFITIFFGANDACLLGPRPDSTYVPREKFMQNLQHFIRSVLLVFKEAKVVLITPPPIDAKAPLSAEDEEDEAERLSFCKKARAYLSWNSKRNFAKACEEVASEYRDNDRFVLLDFWTKLNVDECGGVEKFEKMDRENRLPGSALPDAKRFQKGVFTDGLHFGPRAQEVLGRELLAVVTDKWPDLKHEKTT